MWDRLLIDAIFEMHEHVDAARKVYKVATDISAERQKEGKGLQNKDWYVIGQNLGIIFNNISTNGKHTRG